MAFRRVATKYTCRAYIITPNRIGIAPALPRLLVGSKPLLEVGVDAWVPYLAPLFAPLHTVYGKFIDTPAVKIEAFHLHTNGSISIFLDKFASVKKRRGFDRLRLCPCIEELI